VQKLNVVKRSGKKEPYDQSKIQRQIQYACEDIEKVSESMIEMNMNLELYDGITTEHLDQLILNSAANLTIAEHGHVNYELVAGRLQNSILRKKVYGQFHPPSLLEIVKVNVEANLYTPDLLEWYSTSEWTQLGSVIDHSKDEKMTLSAISQFESKYLISNRSTGKLYETPQVRYMIIAAVVMQAEKTNRMEMIASLYHTLSNGQVSTATPIAAGLGTKTKQFSSCVKISVDDTLDSIFAAGEMMGKYASKRAGIGFEAGRIRRAGAPIRNGEIAHTGLVPFIKKWFGDLRATSQGGIRNASATMFFPVWHYDFEDLVVLKNNKGTHETRERHLDYAFITCKYLWRRFKNNQPITLFCPHSAVGLYDAYYTDQNEFIRLYEQYENDPLVDKKVVSADSVFGTLLRERSETNRIYLGFVDNWANGPIDVKKHPIVQSNLCMEILGPTTPFQRIEDINGEIFLCTLASINWGKFRKPSDMKSAVQDSVRMLNNVLDYQDFLSVQSAKSNNNFRPLGVGVTNLAYWHAKRGMKYGTPESLAMVKSWMEHQYFYALSASVQLAKERGPCDQWKDTCYASGKFLWELRATGVNALTDFTPDASLDWESLRAEMQVYGVRNALLGAIAPVESSSVMIGSTNGIAIPKSLISTKESKGVSKSQVVPEYDKLKSKYQLMFETNVVDYLKVAAVMQVYICQSISTDTFYDPGKYPDGKVDATEIARNVMLAQIWGIKTLYYNITNKVGSKKQLEEVIDPIKLEICEACVL
jgi:ribonucleoside-diphosphate reductase alpha chain